MHLASLFLSFAVPALVKAYDVLLFEESEGCAIDFTLKNIDVGQCLALGRTYYTSARLRYGQDPSLRLEVYTFKGNDECAIRVGKGTTSGDCVTSENKEKIITGIALIRVQADNQEDLAELK